VSFPSWAFATICFCFYFILNRLSILMFSMDVGENATFITTSEWKCELISDIVREDLCCVVVSYSLLSLSVSMGKDPDRNESNM
jgi:hypothetical protein